MTEVTRGPAEKAIVQTSHDAAIWTTRPDVEFTGYSEGQNEIIGNATFVLHWGTVCRAGEDTAGLIPQQSDLAGLLVRVCKQESGGSVTYGDDTYEPRWHGKLLTPDDQQNGGAESGTTNYTAMGIGGLMNERACRFGRTLKGDGSTAAVLHMLPTFNRLPAGDRSTSTFTVGGKSVYIHDLRNEAGGNKWTTRQILDYLMACNFRWESSPTVTGSGQVGLAWSIDDPSGCLGYTPSEYDASGKTLHQVWLDLCGHNRGLTFHVDYVVNEMVIYVESGLAASLNTGTWTIPANAHQWDQTDDGDPFLYGVSIREVADEVADEIIIEGSPRIIGMTVAIWGSGDPFTANASAGLTKGWSDGNETSKNTWMANNPFGSPRLSYAHAWQRLVIKPAWDLAQYDAATQGLSNSYDVNGTGTGLHGYEGLLGTTEHLASGATVEFPALALTAERDLPCALGFTALSVGPRQDYVVVEETSTGFYEDRSTEWGLTIEPTPPAVVLDDGAYGTNIKATLQAGRKILVTMALRDVLPFAVSWRRTQSEWPNTTPRTKIIRRPDLTQEYLCDDMVTGVSADGGGTLVKLSSQVTTRDNLPQMLALLGQARAWYEEPYTIVSFTDRGTWDTDADYRPGTMLRDWIHNGTTRSINAVVTRRTVRLEYAQGEGGQQVPYWSTTYETDVVYPDLEAVL